MADTPPPTLDARAILFTIAMVVTASILAVTAVTIWAPDSTVAVSTIVGLVTPIITVLLLGLQISAGQKQAAVAVEQVHKLVNSTSTDQFTRIDALRAQIESMGGQPTNGGVKVPKEKA